MARSEVLRRACRSVTKLVRGGRWDGLVDECFARLVDDAEVQGQAVSERGPIQSPLTRLALRATLSRKGRATVLKVKPVGRTGTAFLF